MTLKCSIILSLTSFTLMLSQNVKTTETEISNGITTNYYNDNKLNKIVVNVLGVNYANSIIIEQEKKQISLRLSGNKDVLIIYELIDGIVVKSFFYRNQLVMYTNNIDYSDEKLPPNVMLSQYISNGSKNNLIKNIVLMQDIEVNLDKPFKVFTFLDIDKQSRSLDELFSKIGASFSQDDALLKIFNSQYRHNEDEKLLKYIVTDNSGRIVEGFILDGEVKGENFSGKIKVYEKSKLIESKTVNSSNYQKLIENY